MSSSYKKTFYKNFVIQHYVDVTEHGLAGGWGKSQRLLVCIYFAGQQPTIKSCAPSLVI